ncbi:MAG TPA: S8 family serine peptidase [Chthoniobacteraceae bacterium]|jgi:subtilisin family serine protease|nr:S8 family serine peptidase [Chthoniobacteraceae bacterium]
MLTLKTLRRVVSTGLLLALVVLGLVFFLARRAQPLPSAADAVAPSPAPVIVIPTLPAPPAPANAGAAPAAAQALSQSTADWLTRRFPDSQILQQRERLATHDGTFQREYLLDTQFKYPAVEVRETWQRAPSAPGANGVAAAPAAPAETLLKREAWVADHFLLKPRPGLDIAALDAAVIASGGSLDQTTLARNGLLIVRLAQPNLGAVEAAVAAFSKANGPAVYAEPDYLVFTSAVPNDPSFSQQWGLEDSSSNGDINAVAGWDLRTSAAGVLVAVIDTGVRYTHQDIRDNIWQNPGEVAGNGLDDDHDGWVDDVHGVNFYGNTADPNDDEGHGTHVAGILGASGNNGLGIAGVAWQVTIMPIKFQDSHGSGASSDAVRAIDFAVAHGAQILSNSWGSNSFSQALHDSIATAGAAGVLCVAAAGNDHANTDVTPVYPAGFDVDTIIAVGNEGGGYPVYSSNFGVKSVDLFAPGYNIYSLGIASDTDYETLTGTSQATPFVSGVLALLKAEFPDKTAAWLKQRLLETARPNGNLYNYSVTGAQLDLYNALANVTPAPVAITADPVATDVYSGEAIDLYVNNTGGGRVQYQWYKDDVALAGQTSATLSLANPTDADSGAYYVIVRNFASSARSKTVTIVVRNAAPQLTLAPAGARVLAGQAVDLKAAFKGSRPMTFQWERNGSPVDGATDPRLYLYPVTAEQAGTYRLTATNAFGSYTTDPVQVTIVSSYLETWEQVAPKPTSESFQRVAWLNGGFVAVGSNGAIARSADGAQWQITTPATSSWLYGAAYGNGTYVAVGGYATIVSSTDGDHWVSRLSGSGQFNDVAFGNAAFVAVGGYSAYRSTDGVSWSGNSITDYLSLSTPTIAFGNGRFVVAGAGSSSYSNVFSSTDGITWVKASLSNIFDSAAVSFAGGTFWLSSGGGIYSSTDGLTWTVFRSGSFGRLLPSGGSLYYTDQYSARISRISSTDPQAAGETLFAAGSLPGLTGMAEGGGRIVAVGGSGLLVASGDGVAFANQSHFTNYPIIGLVQFNGQFLTVDLSGGVYTSANGADWTHLADIARASYFDLASVAAGNGLIVVTSQDDRSYASTDGVQWANHLIGPQQRFYSAPPVSCFGDSFWIPGRNGDPVFRSTDGLNWTAATRMPQAYGGGRYLAFDYDNGLVAGVSTDGVTWQFHPYPGTNYGGAICYAGGKFHLVDGYGYLTSVDGVTWTNTPTTGLEGYPGRLFVQDGMFVVTGYGISLSLDGVNWIKRVNTQVASAISAPGLLLASAPSSGGGPSRIIRAVQPPVLPPAAPLVTTVAASSVRARQATLTGAVDCDGADTTITFAWGETANLGHSVTLAPVAASRGAQLFSSAAMNLLPGTQYYFQVSATNSEGTAAGDKLTFTTLANTPPVATDDGPIVLATPGATAIPVLANDSDADGDTLTITSFAAPPHGTVAVTATGLSYTPASGFPGTDQFTYTIADLSGATATATVRVRSNAAPIGTEDVYEQLVGPGPFLLHVLDNDHDPDGDALTLTRVDSAFNGTTAISGQTVSYQPRAGYAGPDQFWYTVGDPYGKTAYVKVTLYVSPGRPAAPAASLLVAGGETFFQTPPEFYFPDGTKITGFGPPALSDFRHVASTITLAVGRTTLSGILVQQETGARTVLAATTLAAPGAAPSTFLSFSNPVLSPHGALAFIARVKAPGARGAIAQGVWSNVFSNDGSLALALKSGTPLTGNGLPAGASVTTFTSVEAIDGALYVLGQLSAPGGAVLLRIDATGTHVLLRVKGTLSPGVTISTLSVLQPALASAGQGRWGGAEGLVAKATLSDKSTALLKIAADGSVSRLLSTWQAPAPGDSFAWSAFGLPALTPDGGAAFTGTLKAGAKAVLGRRGSATTDSKVAEVGQTATDAGVAQYASFYDPVAGDRGLAWLALLRGTGVTPTNRVGLWWNDDTQTRKLAQLNEAAPDAAGHVITPALNGPRWQALSSIALPGGAQGGPVVLGKVAGKTVTAANNSGLWAVDSAGVFRQLLRTGPGQLAGDVRSIRSLTTLAADAGAFGVGRSYNSTGSLVVKVIFTNNTQALLRVDIP